MKKVIFAAFILLVFLILAGRKTVKHFWFGKTLSTRQVCKKWGSLPFNEEKFKSVGEDGLSKRAQMACSLLKNQKRYVGRNVDEVIKLFGKPDGHYFSELIPAYLIEIGKTSEEGSWQIVLLIDRKDNISKVIVHKNCCD